MSLINEALKKAQRARHEHSAAPTPSSESGETGVVAKRAEPRSAKSIALIVSSALALVVVSVVITGLWLRHGSRLPPLPAESKTSSIAKAPEVAPSAPIAPAAATPPVVAPVASTATVPTSVPPNGAKPISAPSTAAQPSSTPASSGAAPLTDAKPAAAAVPVTPVPPAAPQADERVHVFVDALHVMGIRSSGNDSRVLMNDRVYRVNDVVDRTLGVRLTKVDTDHLTFTDPNGAVYVKFF
jgi:hypothetical protein